MISALSTVTRGRSGRSPALPYPPTSYIILSGNMLKNSERRLNGHFH